MPSNRIYVHLSVLKPILGSPIENQTDNFEVKKAPYLLNISNKVRIKSFIFNFCHTFVKTKKSSIFISLDEILSFSLLSQTKF